MKNSSTSTFRIIALCKDGTDLTIGRGFAQLQAEIVRRRLLSWNVFREVFVEAELDELCREHVVPVAENRRGQLQFAIG